MYLLFWEFFFYVFNLKSSFAVLFLHFSECIFLENDLFIYLFFILFFFGGGDTPTKEY